MFPKSLNEFVHTDNGVTCYDRGFMDLSTVQECSGAVDYAKSFNSKAFYSGEGNWSYKPMGCSIHDTGAIIFNKHYNGGRRNSYTSICWKGSMEFELTAR